MRQRRQILARYGKALAIPAAIVCILALSIMFVADVYLHHALEKTIAYDAENRARNWSEDIISRTPELELIAIGRSPDRGGLDGLRGSAEKNGIYWIRLYSPKGLLLLDLDDSGFHPASDRHSGDAIAREAFRSGEGQTTLRETTDSDGLSRVLVETYIPVDSHDGRRFGVMKVTVDQTGFAQSLNGVFHNLNILLIFGSAVVYLIPSLVLIFKAEQLRGKDKALLELSQFDPLTGLLNRREFNNRCAALFDRRRFQLIGILFVDVDRFKNVNDDLGHEFGDALLKHISTRIVSALGPTDLIGRIGGDEFMIVSSFTTRSDLADLGNAIQAAIDAPFSHNGTTITPSLSLGGHVSRPGETLEAAIHAADLATYQAKANGRAQLVMYSPEMGSAQDRRRAIEAMLRDALASDSGLFVEYQPIFGNKAAEIVGFEALLRLRSQRGNPISPAEFIPIAEDSGLIVQIGEWTLTKVLKTARDWPEDLFVAVNLSAVQFKDGNIVEMVRDRLFEAAFDPARLELEVTESLILESDEDVKEQLAALKAMGVSIALDDFGTGYSSLGYLWKYQFDKLKLDRAFLEGFNFASDKYRQVISTIVELGQNLGMELTAEGVETPQQLSMLAEIGFDQFQGFLLGRPMSADAAAALLTTEPHRKAAG
ncbi:putative bifunctional diguanylate cyclase/phosphodiesterase [Flavimaricola marinus]|nr:GGDEF and EAL domain-containing protein [Flavimaricola marinus]